MTNGELRQDDVIERKGRFFLRNRALATRSFLTREAAQGFLLAYWHNRPEEVGNAYGYLCPQCGKGTELTLAKGVVARRVPLTAQEPVEPWSRRDHAYCASCIWSGRVHHLIKVELRVEPVPTDGGECL